MDYVDRMMDLSQNAVLWYQVHKDLRYRHRQDQTKRSEMFVEQLTPDPMHLQTEAPRKESFGCHRNSQIPLNRVFHLALQIHKADSRDGVLFL